MVRGLTVFGRASAFLKKRLAACGIAPGAEPEIDGLAAAVDRPVQVDPAALDLDVGLVDPPRAVGRAQVGPQPLLQFHGIGLDPAVDGRVVDRYAAVPQHQFKVAVGDRELQVPAHRPQDHLRRELPALERTLPPCHPRYAPDVSNPALLPDQPAAANLATEPIDEPGDLAKHRIVTTTHFGRDAWVFPPATGSSIARSVQFKPRLVVNSVRAALAAAVGGLGVTRLYTYHVAERVHDGSLQLLLRDAEPPAMPVNLLMPQGRMSVPKVRAFVDFAVPRLRAEFARLSTEAVALKS